MDLKAQSHSRTSFENEDFIALDLDEFTIYRPHSSQRSRKLGGLEERTTANELVSLHDVEGRGSSSWYFDGVIRHAQAKAQARKYVKMVPCRIFSIGGFENTDWHTVGSAIWIQSDAARKLGVWYCLRNPSAEYERYHKPFLWLADLAKHLVDYLNAHDRVFLSRFKEQFYSWLQCTHGTDKTFQQWLEAYNDTDFRRIVAAHATFLYNQAALLGDEYTLHPVWSEIDSVWMDAVQRQTEQVKSYQTIVTPFVYECFKHLPWANFLDAQHPTLRQKLRHTRTDPSVSFRPIARAQLDSAARSSLTEMSQDSIRIGDTVAIKSDAQSKWKSKYSSWYAYVQGTKQQTRGVHLSLIWLYRPSDTACQNMRYPYVNELFLSDHCNCDDTPIYAHEVLSKPRVAFFGNADTSKADFFVRQKYNEADSAWVTLKMSDFECVCKAPKKAEVYTIGATFLIRIGFLESAALEPVELLELVNHEVRVRRLKRRISYGDHEADPNELVYTSKLEIVPRSSICRQCHVRFFSIEDQRAGKIPIPYCRKGTGDFYYITSMEESETFEAIVPLIRPWPTSLKQGFDPSSVSPRPKMRGLDIFCGGGSLGRGLEEGGSVKMEWAVDYFKQAIHTYSANIDDYNSMKLYYGSVNDYLSQAMKGRQGELVAQSGEVDFISAGSPCQGYSSMNFSKESDKSLINISMVASVVAFVDFYRPKYALLENVLGMAKCGQKNRDQNVFAQILCALVSLGYQVRPFILDAWSFGCPQSRTRLFISIAAPGLTPLSDPPQSHAHPDGITGRALGKTANGLSLGERYWGPTPFEYTTIREATKDLPLNEDGRVDCIPFPDHRNTQKISIINQTRICQIPKHPENMTFVKSAKLGWQAETQMKTWNWNQSVRSNAKSRAWGRVAPDGLIRTVTTACSPPDGICGEWLHWEADRPITIMEARRAQGFPDCEVIVGAPLMQWKIIGNSVARPVALALGVALRTAWLANEEDAKASAKQFARDLEAARQAATRSVVKVTKLSKEPLPMDRDATDTPDPIALSEAEHSSSDNSAASSPSSGRTVTRETTTSEVTVSKADISIEIRLKTFNTGKDKRSNATKYHEAEKLGEA